MLCFVIIRVMLIVDCIKTFNEYDRLGQTVWSISALSIALRENHAALRKTIERLCGAGILARISRGLYLFALTSRGRDQVLGEIIAMLRPGEYCFESLESAAQKWNLVSQTPLGALTVMTTGRRGRFETPYGTVEFTHTDAPVGEVLRNTVPRDGFIPIATKEYTAHHLKRCGRTTELAEAQSTNWEE